MNRIAGEPDYPLSDAHSANVIMREAKEAHDKFAGLARGCAIRGTKGPWRQRLRKRETESST